jgi:cytochrome c biogenesis protein CcmG/thiol:disulfide interchange protein DsbE
MRPRRLLALAAVAAVLLAACAQQPPAAPDAGGRPAASASTAPTKPGVIRARFAGFAGGPGFALPEDLRGRPLVLNVWASWCVPCRKEMPAFQSVYLRARGTVGFLGVDYLDEADAARRLAADTGVTYPLAADPKGIEVAKLGSDGAANDAVLLGGRGAARPPLRRAGRRPPARRDPLLPRRRGAMRTRPSRRRPSALPVVRPRLPVRLR